MKTLAMLQKREKVLAFIAVGAVLLLLVVPMLRAVFVAPVEASRQQLAAATDELVQMAGEAVKLKQAGLSLKEWRGRSLPPNSLDAQRLYQAWLTDLAQMAELKNLKVTPGRRVPKGSVYTASLVTLEGEADLKQLTHFLYLLNRADLAHRATSLTVQPSGNSGNPSLKITLTAEGLSVGGTAERPYLFAQSTLQEGFQSRSDEQPVEIVAANGFPAEPGFRIRIGSEYLTVTDIASSRWKVRGGVDATRAANHAAGDVVEFAPVHPDYAARTLNDYHHLLQHSPFTKPSPTSPAPINGTTVVVSSDKAAETYLAASIRKEDAAEAWLYCRTNSERTVLHEGAELKVDGLEAVVVTIKPDYMVLKQDDVLWKLSLGQTLRSLQKLPQAGWAGPKQSEPAKANLAGPGSDPPPPPLATDAL